MSPDSSVWSLCKRTKRDTKPVPTTVSGPSSSSSSDTLLIKRTCAGASAAGAFFCGACCAVSVSRFLRSSGSGGSEKVGHFEDLSTCVYQLWSAAAAGTHCRRRLLFEILYCKSLSFKILHSLSSVVVVLTGADKCWCGGGGARFPSCFALLCFTLAA